MNIDLEGPSFADFDLYVTYDGRTPTRDEYDDRSAGSGSSESVSGTFLGSTDVVIMVYADGGCGEYSVSISEDGPSNPHPVAEARRPEMSLFRGVHSNCDE